MRAKPDKSHSIAARHSQSRGVAALFEQLAAREETYARMQDEFLENIIRHRRARTGKPFRDTKRQQEFIRAADEDAATGEKVVEELSAKMNDGELLTSALTSEHQQLEFDEAMAVTYPPEDREMAQRMIEFRRQTIQIITEFVEASPFKGQVVSLWNRKGKKSP